MAIFLFPTPTPVLPTLNGYSVHKKTAFASAVAEAVSGREVTAALEVYPVWEFELTFEALRDKTQNTIPNAFMGNYLELEQVQTIFMSCQGQYGRFYYDDPTDNSRAGYPLGTGDGVETTFRAVRDWGFGDLALIEPVGGINQTKPITLKLNGTPTAAYTISADNQNFVFNTAPGLGVAITLDYYFYYLCRFLEDMSDFEQFLTDLWALKALRFRSTKDNSGTFLVAS